MSRKIMIGCGATFLIALMLVCALSFGVMGIARNVQAQGKLPNAGIAGATGSPNVLGVLEFYGENTLTVTTAQGPRTIGLTDKTTVRRGSEGAPATFADLRPGVSLAIWGDPGNNRRDLVARVIVIFAK
ncbi:MAG: hypothetical protein HY868_07205 [Chloroflexi bacterium]|nr:hypothetical protein [Chloroflexota bacterium]